VLASGRSRRPGAAQLLLGNTGSRQRYAVVRVCGLGTLTGERRRPSQAALLVEHHPDMGEAVSSPTLDRNVRELRVHRDCALGRLPLPREGGALVAYLHVH
jgi:hypothetical protein